MLRQRFDDAMRRQSTIEVDYRSDNEAKKPKIVPVSHTNVSIPKKPIFQYPLLTLVLGVVLGVVFTLAYTQKYTLLPPMTGETLLSPRAEGFHDILLRTRGKESGDSDEGGVAATFAEAFPVTAAVHELKASRLTSSLHDRTSRSLHQQNDQYPIRSPPVSPPTSPLQSPSYSTRSLEAASIDIWREENDIESDGIIDEASEEDF
jgi:hypothetical protein